MSKNKLVLIIDGNWLLMSRLSAIINKYDNNEEFAAELKLLLIKSIKLVLKQFNSIDNIMFVTDGGSWRTKVPIPSCLHHEIYGKDVEYKGTRERNEDLDWDLIFNVFEEFITNLQNNGINIYKEKDIEGDDWCWYLSHMLNDNNINCIIWSKDKDLTQLVNVDNNKCFTAWWNKENGCYISNYNEEVLDFLFNINYNDNEIVLNNILNNSSSVNKINPTNIIIEKILKGDQSDNVLPTILRKPKPGAKTDRQFKISAKDIDYNLMYKDNQSVYNYLYSICEQKKYKGHLTNTFEEIYEHFQYNRQMVALDKTSYPQYILDIMDTYKNYQTPDNINSIISKIESEYIASKNKLSSILEFI